MSTDSFKEFSKTAQPEEHEINMFDQVFLDAIERGGYDEESLRTIDPLLWARGKTGQVLNLYASQVDDPELMAYFIQTGQYEWPPEVKSTVMEALRKGGLL